MIFDPEKVERMPAEEFRECDSKHEKKLLVWASDYDALLALYRESRNLIERVAKDRADSGYHDDLQAELEGRE